MKNKIIKNTTITFSKKYKYNFMFKYVQNKKKL